MKPSRCHSLLTTATAIALLAGCVQLHHVPPGQSVALAMAKKADLVTLPMEMQSKPVASASAEARPEPELPDSTTEKIADSFTVGNLCMEQGKYAEAASAYQQVVH